MNYKITNVDNVVVGTYHTTKFKLNKLQVFFKLPLTKDLYIKTKLLSDIINSQSKKYHSTKLLRRKQIDMFNLSVNNASYIVGESVLTEFTFSFISEKYTNPEYLDNVLEYLNEIIFNQLFEGDKTESKLEFFKKILTTSIKEKYSKPINILSNEIIYGVEKDNIYYENTSEMFDVIEKITLKDLEEFYKYFLNNSEVIISYVGDNTEEEFVKKLKRNFNTKSFLPFEKIKRSLLKPDSNLISEGKLYRKQEITNIRILYTFDEFLTEKEILARYVSHHIISGGSGRLFKIVREENSLCYSIYLSNQTDKGHYFTINTGVDFHNVDKAINLIKEIMEDIRVNGVTEEELEKSKQIEIRDHTDNLYISPNSMLTFVTDKILYDIYDPKEAIEIIKNVTSDDIKSLLNKTTLRAIYMMGENYEEN